MKKTPLIIAICFCFLLCCCQSTEKSQLAMDKGISLMYDKGQFQQAEEMFTQAIQYKNDNYEAYYLRGCCKFNRNQLDEAILDIEKALDLNPGYADAEFTLGRIYFIKDDIDMSCYYYKASMQHGRDNVEDLIKGCP